MDKLISKGKAALSGGGGHSTSGQPAHGAGQKDTIDKGINSIQSKFGIDKDGKYDKYEEKITDFGRGQYETKSGKKVSDKISN